MVVSIMLLLYSKFSAFQFALSLILTLSFRYVHFVSGLAHVTLLNSTQEAWIRGGKNGLVFAADTAAVSMNGHITDYPSKMETTLLQIPTTGGKIPEHRVLHDGACCGSDIEL